MVEVTLCVVIVTYNSGDDVVRCVEALEDAVSCPYAVVVVDNASSDGVVDVLVDRFSNVRVIQMTENVGFARAVNVGMRASEAPFVLVLNPDTIASPASIDVLLRFAADTDGLGLAAPRLFYPDGRDQGTARSFPTAAAGIFGRRSPLTRRFPGNRWSRRFLSGSDAGDEPFVCDWVSGACMLIPRRTIEETGGFDERYFLFWEDADWCHRMANRGLKVWTVPGSVVVHKEGGSRSGWPTSVIKHFHRGAYLYWKTFEAPQVWNPLRWIAAGALGARALTLITINKLSVRTSPRGPSTSPLLQR